MKKNSFFEERKNLMANYQLPDYYHSGNDPHSVIVSFLSNGGMKFHFKTGHPFNEPHFEYTVSDKTTCDHMGDHIMIVFDDSSVYKIRASHKSNDTNCQILFTAVDAWIMGFKCGVSSSARPKYIYEAVKRFESAGPAVHSSAPGSEPTPVRVAPAATTPARASATVAPAATTPARASATVAPAVTTPARAPATVAPAVTTPVRAPATVAPAVTTPVRAPATVAPAVTTPVRAPATVAPAAVPIGLSPISRYTLSKKYVFNSAEYFIHFSRDIMTVEQPGGNPQGNSSWHYTATPSSYYFIENETLTIIGVGYDTLNVKLCYPDIDFSELKTALDAWFECTRLGVDYRMRPAYIKYMIESLISR